MPARVVRVWRIITEVNDQRMTVNYSDCLRQLEILLVFRPFPIVLAAEYVINKASEREFLFSRNFAVPPTQWSAVKRDRWNRNVSGYAM